VRQQSKHRHPNKHQADKRFLVAFDYIDCVKLTQDTHIQTMPTADLARAKLRRPPAVDVGKMPICHLPYHHTTLHSALVAESSAA
jgi:hypothetical protein